MVKLYATHSGIKSTENTSIRFIPKITTGAGNKDTHTHASALLALACDKDGIAKAIQLTYLNPKTGEKLEGLSVSKRTIGNLTGYVVNITPEIKTAEITFIAEGIETALSIRDTLHATQHNQSQVIATLGKSNLANVSQTNLAQKIVLVLDNDKQDWQQDKGIQKAISHLKTHGKQVYCMQPKSIHNQKTDYNDFAKAGRFDEVTKDIHMAIDALNTKTKDDVTFKNEAPSHTRDNKISKTIDLERELIG